MQSALEQAGALMKEWDASIALMQKALQKSNRARSATRDMQESSEAWKFDMELSLGMTEEARRRFLSAQANAIQSMVNNNIATSSTKWPAMITSTSEAIEHATSAAIASYENAKLIANHIQKKEEFIKIDKSYDFNSFINVDGMGEIQISSIKKYFSLKENLRVLNELSIYLNIENEIFNNYGKFKDLSFMITGKLNNISRAEVKSIIEKNSGKILSSVSQKLNYLIIGDKPTAKKVNKAKELNVRIINQEELFKLLN